MQLQEDLEEIRGHGFQLVAVSADRPEKASASREEKGLDYALYSDAPMSAARTLGIAWRLGGELLETYAGYGIDVEEASGHDHHILPVPAVLVTAEAEIRYQYIHPDHTRRLPPDVLRSMVGAAAREASAVEV